MAREMSESKGARGKKPGLEGGRITLLGSQQITLKSAGKASQAASQCFLADGSSLEFSLKTRIHTECRVRSSLYRWVTHSSELSVGFDDIGHNKYHC